MEDKYVQTVNKVHRYLVELFQKPGQENDRIKIADGCDDIFLWIREDDRTPTDRPEDKKDDIEVYEINDSNLKSISFYLYADGSISDYTVECTYDESTGALIIDDLHVL